MKKTFLEKKRMLLSMLTLVAFLFVGMGSAAAQASATDLAQAQNLSEKVVKINEDAQSLEDGTAKKVYYTQLVSFYNEIIEDVEENNATYVQAIKANFSQMPTGPQGTIIKAHHPLTSVAAE